MNDNEITVEQAQARLVSEARGWFYAWLGGEGRTVDVHVYPQGVDPAGHYLPTVRIRLLSDRTWEYA